MSIKRSREEDSGAHDPKRQREDVSNIPAFQQIVPTYKRKEEVESDSDNDEASGNRVSNVRTVEKKANKELLHRIRLKEQGIELDDDEDMDAMVNSGKASGMNGEDGDDDHEELVKYNKKLAERLKSTSTTTSTSSSSTTSGADGSDTFLRNSAARLASKMQSGQNAVVDEEETKREQERLQRIQDVFSKQDGPIESFAMRGRWDAETGGYAERGAMTKEDVEDDAWLKQLHEERDVGRDEEEGVSDLSDSEESKEARKAKAARLAADPVAAKMAKLAKEDAKRWSNLDAEAERVDKKSVIQTLVKLLQPGETVKKAMERLAPPKKGPVIVKKNVRKSDQAAAPASNTSSSMHNGGGGGSASEAEKKRAAHMAELGGALDSLTALGDLDAPRRTREELEAMLLTTTTTSTATSTAGSSSGSR